MTMKKLDIKIGDKFGDWTVISLDCVSRNKSRYVKCECKCGILNEINVSSLRNGRSSSCKSCSKRKTTPVLNIGDKYKHWTILEGPVYKNSTAYYKVKCDCGNELYKLPLEILSKTKYFQCQRCSHKENMEELKIKNGQVGKLTKTKYTKLKKSAEKRNIQFDVSMNYLWNLFLCQKQICSITGDYIANIEEASLDRIDSSIGYLEGNLQWTTQQANLSKHIMTMEELRIFCEKVLNHTNQQPSTPLTKCEGSETNP